jgi:tetratricopeptide (TPR) repeat protein
MEAELPPEWESYARELLSWSHNRRGELLSEQAASAVGGEDPAEADTLDAQALADFEKALEFDPQNWKALHNRGVSYALQGDFDASLADFEKVTKLNADYANTWFNLGELRYERGEYGQAIKDYSRAVELDADDAGALTGRGIALLAAGRYQEALKDFNRVIQLEPRSAEAYAHRGDAYQYLSRWDQAASDYRYANQLDNQSPRVYLGAAWLMSTCPDERYRQTELALQAAQRAIELGGRGDYRVLDTLAAAQANAGQFAEAVSAMKEAIEVATRDEIKNALRKRMQLYEREQPYRQGRETPEADPSPETSP